jgi:uncharacterized protein YjbI with pentapeptide repeats
LGFSEPVRATPILLRNLNVKINLSKPQFALLLLAAFSLLCLGYLISRRNRLFLPLEFLDAGWSSSLLFGLSVAGIAVSVLLWQVPKWQVQRSAGLTDENRFDRENESRKTLAQIFGGAFVLAGLYSSVETFDLSREAQITDRFTKAIEQLGALDSAGKRRVEIRLGGIYALERIARDSERDHSVVMEVLTAYVRTNSPSGLKDQKQRKATPQQCTPEIEQCDKPMQDIQAILTVLGRRELKYAKESLDLRYTNLRGVDLNLTVFSGTDFSGADLTGAKLRGATLIAADLNDANLNGADLSHAKLTGALLNSAILSGAVLSEATLNRASLSAAKLDEADLGLANLEGAYLEDASLIKAKLNAAKLSGADLRYAKVSGADFTDVDLRATYGLTQNELESALGSEKTLLPDGLTKPDSWTHRGATF